VSDYRSRTNTEQQAKRDRDILDQLAAAGRRERLLEESLKRGSERRIAERTRGEDRPVRPERVRLDPADLERARAEKEARAWRDANVDAVYLHSDLLWTPPVRPRRKGRVVPGDEFLLSPFEWDIALAVISKARLAWREELHNEIMRRALPEIVAERVTRKSYFNELTGWKNDGRFGLKPNIGQEIRRVGKRAYASHMKSLTRAPKGKRWNHPTWTGCQVRLAA
jgi:hypothetical protein